jgi:hypothetical protein
MGNLFVKTNQSLMTLFITIAIVYLAFKMLRYTWRKLGEGGGEAFND